MRRGFVLLIIIIIIIIKFFFESGTGGISGLVGSG